MTLAYCAAIGLVRIDEVTIGRALGGSSGGFAGLLLAIVVISVAAGFWAGRWRAILLAPAAPAIMAIGSDWAEVSRGTVALIVFGPAALVALPVGVGARRAISLGDRGGAGGRRPAGLAGLGAVVVAAGAAVGWFALAWFALRAALDAHVTCSHEPCFGAPATLGQAGRSTGEIAYGVLQAAVAGIGIAALATIACRLVLVAGRSRLRGPLRVAAAAFAVWALAAIVVDASRTSPAEAARTEGAVSGSPDAIEDKLAACREGVPFPVFDLGRAYAGMKRSFARCNVYDDFAVYMVGYRGAGDRGLSVSGSTPQPGELRSLGCTPTAAVRGVAAFSSPYDLRLFTREVSIEINLTGSPEADPRAVANALRAPGSPAGSALPPRVAPC